MSLRFFSRDALPCPGGLRTPRHSFPGSSSCSFTGNRRRCRYLSDFAIPARGLCNRECNVWEKLEEFSLSGVSMLVRGVSNTLVFIFILVGNGN